MQTAIKAVVDSIKANTDATKTDVDNIKATTDSIKTNVDSVKSSTASIASKQDTLMQKIQSGDLKRKVAIFTTPGTHYWTCPEGVYAISLIMFGAGAGGMGSRVVTNPVLGIGGGGGAFCNRLPIAVSPGQTYALVVGAGGAGGKGGVNTSDISALGGAGGASSAFGFICTGGSPKGYGGVPNNPMLSKGADAARTAYNTGGTSYSPMGTPQNTPFAISEWGSPYPGTYSVYGLSGGSGLGSGGYHRKEDGSWYSFSLPGFGAGGAGGNVIPNNQVSDGQKGGDGIIIIEY